MKLKNFIELHSPFLGELRKKVLKEDSNAEVVLKESPNSNIWEVYIKALGFIEKYEIWTERQGPQWFFVGKRRQ